MQVDKIDYHVNYFLKKHENVQCPVKRAEINLTEM